MNIKLDKYDSQIVLLSKGWFKEDCGELHLTRVEILKHIWAWRCGLQLKHVRIEYILSHMIDMLFALGDLTPSNVKQLLEVARAFHEDTWRYSYGYKATNITDTMVYSILGLFSTLQVLDGEKNDIVLVEMYKVDKSFLPENKNT